MDSHLSSIDKLCRVCGSITTSQRVTCECSANSDDIDNPTKLLKYLNDVSQDDPTIHPRKFCHKCYCVMKRAETDGVKTSQVQTLQWTKHLATNCDTCER